MTAIDAIYHRNYVGLGHCKLEIMCTDEGSTRSTILSDNAMIACFLGTEEAAWGHMQPTAISVKMKASCPYPSPALDSESDIIL